MKLLISLFLVSPAFLYAQKTYDYGAFMQSINAAPYVGKKFRLEAAVKVQTIDTTAEAEVWVRVDKTNKKMGFFYNMTDKPIRTNNWAVYTINGKIDKDAAWLVFGGIYQRKGIFYFDQFRLWIESDKDKFEEVAIDNYDFEADTLQKWYYNKNITGFKVSLTKDSAFHGNQAVKVDGTSFKKRGYGENDSTGKYAFVNGIKIYYETYGTGEPLLLLHGNSSSIKSFELQIPELAKYYQVIAVDTRGQGKSGEDGKTYTYDLFAEDMNAFLNYLHIDSANILGWSDGGNTGLIMAMQYPVKVKKLVSMGANVFIDNTVVDKWVFKELNKQLKELKNNTTTWGKNRLRLVTLLKTEPRHSFDELKNIKCPVLVMAGEKDIIKPEHSKQIAAHIPQSTLLIAPKETHYYPSENAAAFNNAVLGFLKK